jgi:hypothetical protein
MMNSNECVICRENFTAKTRRRITCTTCNAVACFRCFSTYAINKRECMFCNQEISTDFVKTHLSNTSKIKFFNQVIEKEFKNQELLLGPTQVRLKREKTLVLLHDETRRLSSEVRSLVDHEFKFEPQHRNRLLEIKERHVEIQNEIEEINKLNQQSNEEIRKKSFKCSSSDCLGVVTGKDMKCTICLKQFCKDCRVEKFEDHKCDPDELKSVQLISSDSKPCPKCNVPIHRSEGCNQMFCVNCKTIFHWETLKIHKKGFVHNPHYFDYLNANGPPLVFEEEAANEDANEDPCQLDLMIREMKNEQKFKDTICDPELKTEHWTVIASRNTIPQMINGSGAIIEQLRDSITEENIEANNTKLREQYLKSIDAEAFVASPRERYDHYKQNKSPEVAHKIWKKSFVLSQKQNEIKKDLIQLLDLFKTLVTESLIFGYQTKKYPEMFENITQIMDYFNAQLKKTNLGLTYKTQITPKNGVQCGLVHV